MVDYAAIVIGAGFGGLRMLYELRSLGISPVKILETGSDVGGTWYWNRYPGARTDSECFDYMFNFSDELKKEWNWPERYSTQDTVLRYLGTAADKYDMRKDIQFDTSVKSAHYNEATNKWVITTSQGDEYSCTFLISAVGPLSLGRKPPFPGLDSFRGEWYQASQWPNKSVDFTGKRVAVIGTGATGVQVIPVVSHNAKSVTVFQQTPNYVIPARNYPMTPERMHEIKRGYDESWQKVRTQAWGAGNTWGHFNYSDVKDDKELQHKILERGWELGGFRGFIFDTFNDMFSDMDSNDAVCEFIRQKIHAIVKDEKTAELLCPHYPLLSKRPPLGHFYYETFNKSHVKLVSVRDNPIKEITPAGLRTNTDEYEFDVIIFAIGFDAVTGALNAIDIRGPTNQSLAEAWSTKVDTMLGITVAGFPNMFIISGPHSPFATIPVIIDNTVNWIGQAITHMQKNGLKSLEATPKASDAWRETVLAAFNKTILPVSAEKVNSWYVGANVPGKTHDVLFYFGGMPSYFSACQDEADAGFPGFKSVPL
ncbi:putative cyclohexanone monooxygenase [Exophiala viscosa]|uniref:Cyclohexanone monooxygenase n=1 Tax=Exophiala viscosa TaxID=2486360 RepID=A0AAN6DNE5_9EURO|nr:putative cyclohexanone monooxygenase [Exophiala viscosa]